MSKRINLEGERFGRLLVASFSHTGGRGHAYWNVVCDCENKTIVRGSSLRCGDTKSCGCLRDEVVSDTGKLNVGEAHPNWGKNNLVGKEFGRLRVVDRLAKRAWSNAVYLCRCSCGNFTEVRSVNLVSGNTKSCGCLHEERLNSWAGELHPNWNPNLSDEDRHETRCYQEYEEWRATVYKRDNHTCKKCCERGGYLNAHHIEGYAENKELRLDLSNGITLCRDCHYKFHGIYGRGNNTSQQFAEFMKNEDA